MPLLSKAKLLGAQGVRAAEVKELTYRGTDAQHFSAPAITDGLPPGTELLWAAQEAPAASADAGKKYLEEEVQAREREAWRKGFEQATAQGQENLEKALAAERATLAAALQEFANGREAYYQRMETEVVRLVLSIARKILHRESQLDPMLLTGVVRVALEKIADGTSVKLRVPVDQADSWRAAVRSLPGRNLAVEIAADEMLHGPRCLIVTEMGTTDVSLEAQLNEIERGFLDLLTQHPGNGSKGILASS